MQNQRVLVLDFGGQYNQLIARRVRECNVYCEVKPHSMTIDEIKAYDPIALASLLIGGVIMGKGGIFTRAVGVVLGSVLFRLVYTIALRFDMPAFMLKLISSIIVVLAISIPYLKKQMPMIKRRMGIKTQKGGV